MINPIFLRSFMYLAKTKHFTHTAEQLNMTQPGVSQHIKKLETQLGKPLLNRQGKSFELTLAGETLYRYGLQQDKAEAELLKTIVGDDPLMGECKLSCSGSMAMQLYPELLELQKQYPHLTFSIEACSNRSIMERVLNNQSDIGLVTQQIHDPKLLQKPLGEDALCLVVPAKAEVNWQELLQLGFINHPDGYHYGQQLLEANFPEHFSGMDRIPQVGYINQLSQILLPVSQGIGFTVVPRSALDAFSHQELVCRAELLVPVKETIYLITKKYRTLPARYQKVTELLAKQWS